MEWEVPVDFLFNLLWARVNVKKKKQVSGPSLQAFLKDELFSTLAQLLLPSYLCSLKAQSARQADSSRTLSPVEGNASICDQYQA